MTIWPMWYLRMFYSNVGREKGRLYVRETNRERERQRQTDRQAADIQRDRYRERE